MMSFNTVKTAATMTSQDVKERLVTGAKHETAANPATVRVKPKRTRRSITRKFENSWYLEIAALCFSTACTIATGIVLGYYDGKPAPSLSLGITLNAIISILATASRAALVFSVSNALGQLKWVWFNGHSTRSLVDAETFDNASRGPLGAIQMLFSHTRRSVGSVGSVLMVLALAFDPFVQQVVSYTNSLDYLPSPLVSVSQVHSVLIDWSSFGTESAINSAFWRDNFELTPDCPSGNCTWPTFQSVAWVGKCDNDGFWSLNEECNLYITPVEMGPANTNFTRPCVATSPKDGAQVNFTIDIVHALGDCAPGPGGGDSSNCDLAMLTVPIFGVSTLLSIYSMYNGSVQYNLTAPSLEFVVLNWTSDGGWGFSIHTTRCTLDLYLNEYDMWVANGQTNANITSSQALIKSFQITTDTSRGPEYVCYELPNAPAVNFTILLQKLSETIPAGIQRPVIHDPSNDEFGFCIYTAYSIGEGDWQDLVDAAMSTSVDQIVFFDFLPSNNSNHSIIPKDQVSWIFDSESLADSVAQAWLKLGPEVVITNLAASLTEMLHDPSLNSAYDDNGTAYGQSTTPMLGNIGTITAHVKVRWFWLILPYILNVGGILFLLYTMYASKQSRAPLWKCAINAFIYHGIDHHTDMNSDLATIPEMYAQASATRVKLARFGEAENRLVLDAIVTGRQSESW